jgi:hypothetical protein
VTYLRVSEIPAPDNQKPGPLRKELGPAKSDEKGPLLLSLCEKRRVGGKVCVPPTDIPVGRFAVVEDPSEAVFSLFKMAGKMEWASGVASAPRVWVRAAPSGR